MTGSGKSKEQLVNEVYGIIDRGIKRTEGNRDRRAHLMREMLDAVATEVCAIRDLAWATGYVLDGPQDQVIGEDVRNDRIAQLVRIIEDKANSICERLSDTEAPVRALHERSDGEAL